METTHTNLNMLQKEVLVSTDIAGQYWNVSVWDYNSGTNLQNYKQSSCVTHGLGFIKNDYMLCAAYNKPHVVCWNLKGKVKKVVRKKLFNYYIMTNLPFSHNQQK